MLKKALLLCFVLTALSQLAVADDVVLTVESDKPVYPMGDKAHFTARLKNVSQNTYMRSGQMEFRISVSQDGIEIWRWSRWECG